MSSGKGWGKAFGRNSKKKDKEHSDKDKHGAPKNSKGGTGHGSKKQPSGSSSSHEDFAAHINPITVTTTATGTAKVCNFTL